MGVPKYPEFSVKKMFAELKTNETISAYLPDYIEGILPDQEFFHQLIWSLYPAEMYEMIDQSQKKRAINSDDKINDMIELDPEIAKEIMSVIKLPCKKYL